MTFTTGLQVHICLFNSILLCAESPIRVGGCADNLHYRRHANRGSSAMVSREMHASGRDSRLSLRVYAYCPCRGGTTAAMRTKSRPLHLSSVRRHHGDLASSLWNGQWIAPSLVVTVINAAVMTRAMKMPRIRLTSRRTINVRTYARHCYRHVRRMVAVMDT